MTEDLLKARSLIVEALRTHAPCGYGENCEHVVNANPYWKCPTHDLADGLESGRLAVIEVVLVERLVASSQRIKERRCHDPGCEVHITDFCTCGLRQDVDKMHQALTAAMAAGFGKGATP